MKCASALARRGLFRRSLGPMDGFHTPAAALAGTFPPHTHRFFRLHTPTCRLAALQRHGRRCGARPFRDDLCTTSLPIARCSSWLPHAETSACGCRTARRATSARTEHASSGPPGCAAWTRPRPWALRPLPVCDWPGSTTPVAPRATAAAPAAPNGSLRARTPYAGNCPTFRPRRPKSGAPGPGPCRNLLGHRPRTALSLRPPPARLSRPRTSDARPWWRRRTGSETADPVGPATRDRSRGAEGPVTSGVMPRVRSTIPHHLLGTPLRLAAVRLP